MVESNEIKNVVFEKNFQTTLKYEQDGIPMLSPWSVFSVFKDEKMIRDYAITPDIFKVWVDENSIVNFNIRIEKVNKKWPQGELSYFLQVADQGFNTVLEETGIYYNEVGKDKKKKRVARPWDFLMPNTEYATSLEAKERLDVCKQCPRLKANVCHECGCFMPMKTKLAHAECPIGKW
jgi:hypothetical protein